MVLNLTLRRQAGPYSGRVKTGFSERDIISPQRRCRQFAMPFQGGNHGNQSDRIAGRLARRHAASAYKSGLFQGLQASVAIFALSLIHKSFFTFQLGYQVMLFLIFGYLIYASKHMAVDEIADAPPPPPRTELN